MSNRHTVLVIGAGLSGLSAACFVARAGADVIVCEANEKAGGCCATTLVDGYTFHDGAVYLAAVPLVDYAFAKLGLDRAALVPLRRIATPFAVTLPDGAVVTIGEGLDVRVEGAAFDPNATGRQLQTLLDRWAPVYDVAVRRLATEPFSAWRSVKCAWRHLHKFRGTVASELRRFVSDDHVRAALSGTLLHMGVAPDAMPATSMVALVSILTEGLTLPEGGMGRITSALAAAAQTRGTTIRYSSPVRRIMVERGRVTAVELANGERVEADAVISTASPMTTFTSLIDGTAVPRSIRRRIARAPLSHRAISVQLGVATSITPRGLMNMTLPMLDRQREVVAQDPSAIAWPVYSVPTMMLPELAPAGASIIEMFVPVTAEAAGRSWDAAARRRIVDSVAAILQRDCAVQIAVSRVRTPADFRDQMHLYDGALYGLSPIVQPQQQFRQTTPIEHLFLAGQSTYPGYGVGAVLASGIFAARAAVAAV